MGCVELDGDRVSLGKSDNCCKGMTVSWLTMEGEMKEKKEEKSSWLLLELEVGMDHDGLLPGTGCVCGGLMHTRETCLALVL